MSRFSRVGVVGVVAASLLAIGPMVGPATAADGDVMTSFGTNGRFLVSTGPTPAVGAVEMNGVGDGVRTIWIQHSDPSHVLNIGTAANGAPGTTAAQLYPCITSCRIAPGYGEFVLIDTGDQIFDSPPAYPAVSLAVAFAPAGSHFKQPTWMGGGFFVEVHPDSGTSEPYLAFRDVNGVPLQRVGPVGTPEVLVDGRFVVASTEAGAVKLRFHDRDGQIDVNRADKGIASISFTAETPTIEAVVQQSDGGVAVLVAHAAVSGPTALTSYRFDARGTRASTVDGPTLSWTPALVDLPGHAVALVGTTTGPSPANTIVRVDTSSSTPFTQQTLSGGPQVIDGAIGDALGRVVVIGGSAPGPRSTMSVARYLPSGALDGAFGTAGIVNRSLPQSTTRSFALTIGSDQGITAVASQNAGLVVDRLVGSAARAFRDHTALTAFEPTGDAGVFIPVTPARAFDTRTVAIPLAAGSPRAVDLSSIVPAGATAVALNTTAVDPSAAGFARVWSVDDGMPDTSMLNFVAGETVANATISRIGARRSVNVYSQVDADLVLDVVGYWMPRYSSAAGRFVPITPTRLLDTRDGPAKPAAGTVTTLDVHARSDLGLEHASAVAVTVTVAEPEAPGYVTTWPGAPPRPLASSLNVNASGELRTNMSIVGVGTDGTISLFNQSATQLVVDIVGWFTDDSADVSRHGLLEAGSPLRADDSRTTAAGPLKVRVPRIGMVNCCLPTATTTGSPPTAVVYNLTAANTAAAGFLTAYPVSAGASVPLASSVNFDGPDQRRASLAMTPTVDGTVALYANVRTDYVIDLIALIT